MKTSKTTRRGKSGHPLLFRAIPLQLLAVYWFMMALDRGKSMDYILAAVCVLAYHHYFSRWLAFLRNECRPVGYCADSLILRQKNGYVFRTEFKNVTKTKKDRGGYTLHVDTIGRCRIPFWYIGNDLQLILDAHQARLEDLR